MYGCASWYHSLRLVTRQDISAEEVIKKCVLLCGISHLLFHV
jgi:hypothetical protein